MKHNAMTGLDPVQLLDLVRTCSEPFQGYGQD